MYLTAVRTSEMLYLKMKGETLRKKTKKSVQRTIGICFIHGKFLKSLGQIRPQNVSYSKFKLNTCGLLELFVEFSQFLRGQTKSAIKLELLN